jgi:ankyrin repeat protein
LALALLAAGCGGGGGGSEAAETEQQRDPKLDAQLRAAVQERDVERARELLEQGADPDAKDPTGQSAYLYASSEIGPEPAMLELLLEHGADPAALDEQSSTGLIRAAQRGYPELVRPLLDANSPLDHVNRLGWTALAAAVILGDGSEPYVETVRLLLDAGASPTVADIHGLTPAVHAQTLGQTEVAALLREAESAG